MRPVQVWGVLNVTPDSFSDGGRSMAPDAAAARARAMVQAGADVIDIGGESTRPGAAPVSEAEEGSRVIPAMVLIARDHPVRLSVDTTKPSVARAAMEAGATIWNDVSALRAAPDSLDIAAALGCEVVLMHMKGGPSTMQHAPAYDDVVAEVAAFLAERTDAAMAAGIARDRIWLDPGLGFGKTPAHNLALLAGLETITALGFPVLVGASRKATIAHIDPTAADPADRLGGSLALALHAASKGAAAVRVHDVRETVQALAAWAAVDAVGRA